MARITKVDLRRTRAAAGNNKSLLRVLLVATGIVSLCVILIPLMADDGPALSPGLPQYDSKPVVPHEQHVVMEDLQDTKGGDDDKPSKERDQNDASKADSSGSGKDAYHTVFSTGCSTFQDWQSYVFFYHMLHSGQEGPVTRIVSGCDEEDTKVLRDIFETDIAPMAPGRFRLHFTPDFSRIKAGSIFKYVSGILACGRFDAFSLPPSLTQHLRTIV